MLELFSTPEFEISLLLFIALAGYIIASRIDQSVVVAEIILGLIIGPSLLGLINYTDFVAGLAHLGAVVLLFVIGLEFKPKDLVNKNYLLIALLGVIVPWIGGYFVAKLFGYGFGSAVFVGTALTATSIAITANVLRELGKIQSDAGKAIIGAAVIDDVLGLLALSFSTQFVGGQVSNLSLLFVLIKSVGFIIIAFIIGSVYISKFMKKIDDSWFARKYPEFIFIFAMMVAFLYAMLAEAIGLSTIVGAFIAGVSLGGVSLKHSKDYKEGAEYLYIMFASIFFVSLGVLADIKAITPAVVVFIMVLTAVAAATKIIGCGLAARLTRMSKKDSLIVGIGMSPRGEVAMIVALIGLNQGVFGQDIFVSLALLSIITSIITPIAFKSWLYKDERKINPAMNLKFSNHY